MEPSLCQKTKPFKSGWERKCLTSSLLVCGGPKPGCVRCKSFRKELELDSDKTHYFSGRN